MSSTAYCSSCRRLVYTGKHGHEYCPVCASPLSKDADKYEPEAAADRIVKNESLFREINELAARRQQDGEPAEKVGFVCECGQQSCTEIVHLTKEEYEDVRKSAVTFFTVRGHEIPGVEVVTDHREGYQLVEKVGPPSRVAEERAPRGS